MYKPPIHIDQQLLSAYEQTHYCVPELSAVVQLGQICPPLDDYLKAQQLVGGAFVTAYNPRAKLRSATENAYWQATLEAELQQWQRNFLNAVHRDPQAQWPDEPSCFILGLPLAQAVVLGRRYGQHAVLGYTLANGARLGWCH